MKTIEVKGVIIPSDLQEVYDYYGVEATSPIKVINELKQDVRADVEVNINSGGGSVFAGAEIYTALKEHKGKVTTKAVGLAGSSASIILMGGNEVLISPVGQVMIHNVSLGGVSGDYREMEHTATVLKNMNDTLANAYTLKTGKDKAEILALMDAETWFSPESALELGLVDKIMFHGDEQSHSNFSMGAVASSHFVNVLPESIIKEYQAKKEKKQQDELELQQLALNFLQLNEIKL